MRHIVLLWMLLCLGACATRGPLDVACDDLSAIPLPPSRLVQDIQSGTGPVEVGSTGRRMFPQIAKDPSMSGLDHLVVAPDAAMRSQLSELEGDFSSGSILLLSGGGQWGAFGPGFLARLDERGLLPDYTTVTGVSTGALQALFLGTIGDDPAERRQIFRLLMGRYRPAKESDVVDRDPSRIFAVATGSFAGLRPLERRIAGALCDRAVNPVECPVLARLADQRRKVYVGFVRADDGRFYFSNISAIARRAYPAGSAGPPASPAALAEAQRCVTGAALASAAMPVFFQQVRVGPRGREVTYFDGGVRQSVFEAEVAGIVERAGLAGDGKRSPAQLYVLRNGPTTLDRDDDANEPGGALEPAMRAEAIVVNQLEVQSIADLRLAHPVGPIWLMTADGYGREHAHPGDDAGLEGLPHYRTKADGPEACSKKEGVMFAPDFMACIMRFGRARADSEGWRTLSELSLQNNRKAPGS